MCSLGEDLRLCFAVTGDGLLQQTKKSMSFVFLRASENKAVLFCTAVVHALLCGWFLVGLSAFI